MTIDKQALRARAEKATCGEWSLEYGESRFDDDALIHREVAGYIPICRIEGAHPESGFDEDFQMEQQANAEFISAANPATVLALLDENLQLQREKDATEAVALALRDDMRQAREQLAAAERRIAELERSETQFISERDDAESALNDAYKAVMGQPPEWSNWFSFENAIDEIELACELWRNQTDDVIQFRQRIAELEAREVTLPDRKSEIFWPGDAAEFDILGYVIAVKSAIRATGIKVKES
ncbi:ead/Ea22-like family protein [Salmonella enterica]|nr:ead/Ea22-like family protein [Salmonella enterica]EKT1306504.1 ead/Ea22-like family protein [Salmonella enterica]EKT1311335.1 ead/Ea22-like family protein [Salmonella enterica]EKT3010391.1 ead/Ea22-like family protein [Salmonella enterica]EKT3112301.1 ead/Ea22-like family protein [Salmonella enterica]